MYATDFLYDGYRASDFGLIICEFDGEGEPVTGGTITYNSLNSPENDVFTFYGARINEPLEWKFSVAKNPCYYDEPVFTQEEERRIASWLLKRNGGGYKWLQFDQDGYLDVFYKVVMNVAPHQVAGKTIGFDITATSNCGYGFSEEKEVSGVSRYTNPFQVNIESDMDAYIYPVITIHCESENIVFYNQADLYQNSQKNTCTEIHESKGPVDVVLDSENDMITGLSNPENFNWIFPRLLNGLNTFIILSPADDGDVDISIKYREPRRVIV